MVLSPPMLRLIDALARETVRAFLADPVRFEHDPTYPPILPPIRDERTCLYRHFDADLTLLYVGVSYSPKQRKHHHRWASAWFPKVATTTEEWIPTRREALAAERDAIKTEYPLFNIKGRTHV